MSFVSRLHRDYLEQAVHYERRAATVPAKFAPLFRELAAEYRALAAREAQRHTLSRARFLGRRTSTMP